MNGAGTFVTCLPLVLEAGFSAQSSKDHDDIIGLFDSWRMLVEPSDLDAQAIRLQRLLFKAGKGRAAGVFDIQVAAYALSYSLSGPAAVIVVHYDADYDHLSEVEPHLMTRWVVPRGSID